MADTGAPWLDSLREFAGTKEFDGGSDNPIILGWARFIALQYPEMAAYCDAYRHDSIPWCGLTAAYALAKNGIRPPFDANNQLRSFLWANAFADGYGLPCDPRPGALAVFKWNGGGGHVGFVDRIDGRTIYVLGGNQTNAVNVARFAWDNQVVGFFWPDKVAAAPAVLRTPADVRIRMGKAITLAEARRDAQGRLAVYYLPANDGGGAYEVAGINERWHPVAAAKLKGLIEAGRYDEAETFVGDYIGAYTDVADVWTSSWGLEFYLRDSCFHRGPTGGAKILQRALKIRGEDIGQSGDNRDGVDGEVGPLTAAALRRQEGNVEALLLALRQAREDYELAVAGRRENFWAGLVNRWNNQLTVARRFHAEQPKDAEPMPDQSNPLPLPQPTDGTGKPVAISAMIVLDINGTKVTLDASGIIKTLLGSLVTGATTLPAPPVVIPNPPPPPPQQPQPAPPAQPSPEAKPANFLTTLFGILGLGAAAVGEGTGVMPVGSTAGSSVAITSLLATLAGGLGAVSPTLGLIGGALKAFSAFRQWRATQAK